MTTEDATATPVCYRHPDRDTLLSCSRCGRPICAACSIDASVGQRCPECVRSEGAQRVIPVPRSGSRRAGAPATIGIIGLTVAVFLMASPGGDLWLALAQVGAVVANGEWWRVFTAALVHGDFTHIAFNMWALWVLGPQIERTAGTAPFIALYLAAAGAGGAFVFFLRPGIAVGASGAIFGLFGVWANMAVRGRRTWQGRAALRQIGFLLLLNAALPLMIRTIAWEAHLGGLIAGYLIGEAWSRLTGPRHNSTRTAAALAVAALSIIVVAL